MPYPNGVWTQADAETHEFDYQLAKWIGDFLPKDKSIIDFGCGKGTYLQYLQDRGFEELLGIEGSDLQFEFSNVIRADLTQIVKVDAPKGNVICLEVAEHIPRQMQGFFLNNITEYCDKYLILSWGIPGQEGTGHVNCLHNIEVIDILKDYGFKLFLGHTLFARQHISKHCSWFKHSLMIFERI